MKIIEFIEPSPSYPLLTNRVEKSIDYVVDYYQKRDQLAHNGIRVPKFLFRNEWPSTQYVENIVNNVSFRTGLTILKVDKVFSTLMERGSLEAIYESINSVSPKGKYLIYLKASKLNQDFFPLEKLMENNNNLVIVTAKIYSYLQKYNGFELIDIDTVREEEEEVRSLIINNIKSTLSFDIEEDVLEEEVRYLLDKSINSIGGRVLNMSLISHGVNKIKKKMYELYS